MAHPRILESSCKLLSVASPYFTVYTYGKCVMLVREDSMNAVWYYRELHKFTVGIIVAGCSYIYISL